MKQEKEEETEEKEQCHGVAELEVSDATPDGNEEDSDQETEEAMVRESKKRDLSPSDVQAEKEKKQRMDKEVKKWGRTESVNQ